MIQDIKFLRKIYLRLSDRNKRRAIYWVKLFFFWHKNVIASIRLLLLKKKKITNINLFEQRFHSQNGEDGIIKILLYKIGIVNKFCVEFGIHPAEGNTNYLSKKGWNCLWMDGFGYGGKIKKEYITAENINDLFKKYDVPREFDILSIDIDSNDYWIWKSIDGYSPRIVVIEYNSIILPTESKTVKYDPEMVYDGTNYFGASLLALQKLGMTKGYTLIACDKRGVNAFFIRDDLVKDNFQIKKIEEIYKPPRYGKKIKGKYMGWPQSNKSMISV